MYVITKIIEKKKVYVYLNYMKWGKYTMYQQFLMVGVK